MGAGHQGNSSGDKRGEFLAPPLPGRGEELETKLITNDQRLISRDMMEICIKPTIHGLRSFWAGEPQALGGGCWGWVSTPRPDASCWRLSQGVLLSCVLYNKLVNEVNCFPGVL